MDMHVVECNRCSVGWDKRERRCTVYIGSEHLPTVADAPDCPIADRCQHAIQAAHGLCDVRRAGLVCESALVFAGTANAQEHPLAFNANFVSDELVQP